MHAINCSCRRCHSAQGETFEAEGFGPGPSAEFGELSEQVGEAAELELALELLSVSNEEEWEQFLGKLWKGVKKAGKFLRPLGGVLKSVAKAALPMVGGALGSFIPIPGVGTALGSALGSAVSKALELESDELAHEDGELEVARRFVRVAAAAGRNVSAAPQHADPNAAVAQALRGAVRSQLPHADLSAFGAQSARPSSSSSGRWVRRGRSIVLLGA